MLNCVILGDLFAIFSSCWMDHSIRNVFYTFWVIFVILGSLRVKYRLSSAAKKFNMSVSWVIEFSSLEFLFRIKIFSLGVDFEKSCNHGFRLVAAKSILKVSKLKVSKISKRFGLFIQNLFRHYENSSNNILQVSKNCHKNCYKIALNIRKYYLQRTDAPVKWWTLWRKNLAVGSSNDRYVRQIHYRMS